MKNVAARLGFKRGGKVARPKFEFQEKKSGESTLERRHVMKTVATRVYNQMGWSIRAHEAARASLLALNQLRETIPDHEEDERDITTRLATRLGDLVEEFLRIRADKIALADELESALTSTKRDMRLDAAKKMADEEKQQREKGEVSFWPEEDHPETAMPSVPVDPELILQNAEKEIKAAEKAKKTAKSSKKKAVKEDEEKET